MKLLLASAIFCPSPHLFEYFSWDGCRWLEINNVACLSDHAPNVFLHFYKNPIRAD